MDSGPQQRTRRSSVGLPLSRSHRIHQRAADLFGSQQQPVVDEAIVDGGTVTDPVEEAGLQNQFLGQSSKDHTSTRSDEGALVNQPLGSTVPSYNRTVYNFTLDRIRQINPDVIRDFTVTGSADHDAVLSSQVLADLNKLTLDEIPLGPSNTPTPAHQREMIARNRRSSEGRGKRRSLTDSLGVPGRAGVSVVRDSAVIV